jgi:hypothetical protein
MVPRGGIELSYMPLNKCHFWNGGFPVYPSMYPASNSHAACWCGDKTSLLVSGSPGSGRSGWLAVRRSSWRRNGHLPGTLVAGARIRRSAHLLYRLVAWATAPRLLGCVGQCKAANEVREQEQADATFPRQETRNHWFRHLLATKWLRKDPCCHGGKASAPKISLWRSRQDLTPV